MDKLLQNHKCATSQAGNEWAQQFWKDEEKVVECIKQCQGEQKVKGGKGKGHLCSVRSLFNLCTERS